MKVRAITVGQKIPYLAEDKELENYMEQKLQRFYSFKKSFIELAISSGCEINNPCPAFSIGTR